jgi:uncharacterized protein (TIGR02147 family)
MPREGHGVRSQLAQAMGCQLAYLSQVLKGEAHLSLEQAEAANRFLGHGRDESNFFFLLIQLARAGTPALREHLREEMKLAQEKWLSLHDRLEIKKALSAEDQAIYYGAWYYAAIHVALSIPELQTKEALSARFALPLTRVSQVLDFLLSSGLAVRDHGRFKIGNSRIHLDKGSPLIIQHHTHWRVRSLLAFEHEESDELHYSSVITLSRKDIARIKGILVQAIKESDVLMRQSKEEEICGLAMDLFRLR